MDSVYYTIGVELKSFGSPEAGLTAIRSRPIEDLYMAGQVKIRSKLRTAHLLQRHLKKTLFRTQNRPYTDTVKTKLDGFFRLYRPASFAQQLHVTVEYQTFPPVSELSGIEFIEAFLRSLVLENSFCCLFDPTAVDAMLERENPDFRNVMINIYRSVLRAALGCVLTGRPVEALEYDPAAAENASPSGERLPKIFARASSSPTAHENIHLSERITFSRFSSSMNLNLSALAFERSMFFSLLFFDIAPQIFMYGLF